MEEREREERERGERERGEREREDSDRQGGRARMRGRGSVLILCKRERMMMYFVLDYYLVAQVPTVTHIERTYRLEMPTVEDLNPEVGPQELDTNIDGAQGENTHGN